MAAFSLSSELCRIRHGNILVKRSVKRSRSCEPRCVRSKIAILQCAQEEESEEQHRGVREKPSVPGLLAELKKCSRSRDLKRGMELHSRAIHSGLSSNRFLVNNLISMYSKCGSMVDARKIFDTASQDHDVVAWTALIQGYVENGQSQIALELFSVMEKNASGCVPDARTYVAALSACGNLAAKQKQELLLPQGKIDRWLEEGRKIHSKAAINRCCDVFVESSLIDMYAKCGSMEDARNVFNNMIDQRNLVAWTALLQGYVENGESELALDLYEKLGEEEADARTYVAAISACAALAAKCRNSGRITSCGKWFEKGRAIYDRALSRGCCNIFVENTLIDLRAKCGKMVEARMIFDRMVRRDLVSWNVLVLGYVENGESELALEMLIVMDATRVVKDSRTYAAALMACGNLMALEKGKLIHEEIRSRKMDREVVLANCLVDFYGKCGSLEMATQVFDSIATKTVVSWTALMCGYGQQGDVEKVLELFQRMKEQGIAPNEASFVTILTACSHAGLTERGKECFDAMVKGYGISPSVRHYNCLVDLLGRANSLDEAMKVVRSMPCDPNAVTWRIVLGACRKWNNAAVGKLAYEALMKLDGKDAAAYLLMANLSQEDALGRSKGNVRKMQGRTKWIDDAGKVHKFREAAAAERRI